MPPEVLSAPLAHSSRPAMIAGFAVVFGLWLISGEELVRSQADVNRQVEGEPCRVSARPGRAHSRSQRHPDGVYLRDALIDPSPASREAYVAELIQTRQNVDRVMSAYRPLVASTEEQEPWDRRQAELTLM